MEETYQQYRDSVGFRWVYGREAHPEEDPFPGTESADLGWDHPYTETTSMEERAQRASWLKTDQEPDFEIPMMIDYIDDAPNQDDAIKWSYMGGGFYSGYVIDCDGTVIEAVDWAWKDDDGGWYGLPLAHVDQLHAFLDEYLTDPPPCYIGPGTDADTDTDTDSGWDTDEGSESSGGGSGSCSTVAPGWRSGPGPLRLILGLWGSSCMPTAETRYQTR
jgi:hypothetical protein